MLSVYHCPWKVVSNRISAACAGSVVDVEVRVGPVQNVPVNRVETQYVGCTREIVGGHHNGLESLYRNDREAVGAKNGRGVCGNGNGESRGTANGCF